MGSELKEVQVAENGQTDKDNHKTSSENCVPLSKEEKDEALKGLSSSVVEEKISTFGKNETAQKRQHVLVRLLKKFWGLTAWVLEITAIVAFALQNWINGGVVIALLVLNAIIGFVQEQRAAGAVEALKSKLQVIARVFRDGEWKEVAARDLVPGDLVRIRIGDFVPADVKIISGEVDVDQSALTGESESQHKDDGYVVYSGSMVKRGEATSVVVNTGTRTFFGKTIELVSTSAPKLHIESIISKVIWVLLATVIIMLSIAIIVALLVQQKGVNDLLPLVLVLLVSAVPVALPAMFTITMALGSLELVKKGVLITRLSATEDAASMTVLCSDKTGTITLNKLSVFDVLEAEPFSKDDVLIDGALASKEENQDAIDNAFFEAIKEKRLQKRFLKFKQQHFSPFDPKTRRTEAVVKNKQGQWKVSKGALLTLLDLCKSEKKQRESMIEKMQEFASQGARTIAVAAAVEGEDYTLVGIVALSDPPREDSKSVIEELKNLGVKVKMLTGDALQIARHIAQQVSLGPNVINLQEVKKGQHSNKEKSKSKKKNRKDEIELEVDVENVDGFAEIYPEDKHLIVKMLQNNEHIVGMTGDGVNDSPALKQSEVGIAMSNATDIAKGAASAVLTKPGLSPVIDLIRVGRMIHQRIVTWILNKITKTFQTVIFVVIAFLLWGEFIISAFNMLLLLFLVDFVTLSLSTDTVSPSDHPEKWQIFHLVRVSLTLGIFVVGESLLLLYVARIKMDIFEDLDELHTFTFEILFFFGMCTLLIVRERSWFWKSRPSWLLLGAILADTGIILILCSVGIDPVGLKAIPIWQSLTVIAWAIGSALLNDLVKVILFKLLSPTDSLKYEFYEG